MTDAFNISIRHTCDQWSAALSTVSEDIKAANTCLCTALSLKTASQFDVNICLTDNNHVQSMNKTYRAKNAPTNVLSFAFFDLTKSMTLPSISMTGMTETLGDIALAYGVVQTEARNQGKPFTDHVVHLVVHGLLHLLGYDHTDSDQQAEHMEALEIDILARLGITNPYMNQQALPC